MARTNTTKSTEVVVEAAAATEVESVSPYKASILLAERNINVRPQMLYSYVRDGRIKTLEGGKQIELTVLNAWADEYVAKKADREAKKAAKVQAELEAENTEVTEAE